MPQKTSGLPPGQCLMNSALCLSVCVSPGPFCCLPLCLPDSLSPPPTPQLPHPRSPLCSWFGIWRDELLTSVAVCFYKHADKELITGLIVLFAFFSILFILSAIEVPDLFLFVLMNIFDPLFCRMRIILHVIQM